MTNKKDQNKELQVVQKNVFIQKYQKRLTGLNFNDLLMFKTIVSKINSKDTLFKESYVITYNDLDKAGFVSSGRRYKEAVKSLDKLSNIRFEIDTPDELIRLGLLKNKYTFPKQSKEIKVEIYPELAEFFLGIKETFTKYPLKVLQSLTNKYDLLLFEYFQSIQKIGSQKMSIDKLKELLGLKNKYQHMGTFLKDVLDPSIKRINENTDIEITYQKIKTKNKITGLHFFVKGTNKFSVKEYIQSVIDKKIEVNGNIFSISDIERVQNDFNELYKIKVQAQGLSGYVDNQFTIDELKDYITRFERYE